MSKYKIAFFDIDGTIVPFGTGRVPERVQDTLIALQKRGVLLCVATGRSPLTLPNFGRVKFDVFMTFNGSLCFNEQEDIFKAPLNHDDVMQVLENTKKMGRPISIANREFCICNGTEPNLEKYYEIGHEKLIIDPDFDEKIKGEVYQIMMACAPEEYDTVLENAPHIRMAAWWEKAVDMVPADCGKGLAVTKILEYYGFSKEESIAFGDGGNDIDMLKAAGVGVAMENASDTVKEAADVVCDSIDEEGARLYIEEHILNEE